jgi:hypothetical protein
MAEKPLKYRTSVDPRASAARLTLLADLDLCWRKAFPPEVGEFLKPDPFIFYDAFLRYGTTLYDASAEAALATPIRYSKYKAWVDEELKQEICKWVAPLRSRRPRDRSSVAQKPSEWQRWMAASWETFDHPRHLELSVRAAELVDALEGRGGDGYCHSRFTEALYKTLSRRTPVWFDRAHELMSHVAAAEQLEAGTGPALTELARAFGPSADELHNGPPSPTLVAKRQAALKRYRVANGLDAEQFAKKFGVTSSVVRGVVRGDYSHGGHGLESEILDLTKIDAAIWFG